MLSLLAACLLALAPLQEPPPDAKAVEKAVVELETAFTKGKTPERIAAIENAATLADPAVIARIARGLKDADATVQAAAIEALRYLRHADALEALHELAKRDKKLQKDPEQYAKLLKAIGQHGSPSSIPVLAEGGLTPDANLTRARLLALANIRDKAALEQLMTLMHAAGRDKVDEHMQAFQLALIRLTGADHGTSQDAWTAWWNEHKKTFEVSAEPPLLTKPMQMRWDDFWGTYTARERAKKRGERGK
jgi:HEAT repeat protein